MSLCNSVLPAGAVECQKRLAKAKYMLINDVNSSYDTEADFLSLAEHISNINESRTSHLVEIIGYENTTDDPNIITLPNTEKQISNEPIPSMTFNASLSFCDSQQLLKTLNGSTYRVEFFTEDGEKLATFDEGDQVFKGFKASIKALTKGIPVEADPEKMVTMYVFFKQYEEFVNSFVAVPEWGVYPELVNAVPVGLNMRATSKYTSAGGSITVKVTERCGDAFTGLATADFVALRSSDLSDIAFTVVDDGNGAYTVDITKDAVPVNLAVGDSVVIQIQKKTGSVIDYISGELVINVLS
jgi:hypothetical protein